MSKRENVRPVAIYRVEENFLLCYAEFAFYVNKTGWRARPRWAIQWEGFPTAFGMWNSCLCETWGIDSRYVVTRSHALSLHIGVRADLYRGPARRDWQPGADRDGEQYTLSLFRHTAIANTHRQSVPTRYGELPLWTGTSASRTRLSLWPGRRTSCSHASPSSPAAAGQSTSAESDHLCVRRW